MREGTADIMELFPAIKATWTRKSITQKQHYSEPCEGAITGREMRKHSPRVAVLPPCDDTMDLMIEAKDKEQAVFELYRKYGIGGEDLFREVVPHERTDDNRPPKGKKEAPLVVTVPDEEVGMGGLERRVYWPLGNEDWLSPRKRVMKNKVQPENNVDNEEGKTSAAKKPQRKKVTKVKEEWVDEMEEVVIANATNTPQSEKTAVKMLESTISVTKQASASAPPVISASFTKRRLSRRIAATAAAREAAVPLSPMSSGLSSPPSEET
jgi:UV DNA damage endonuclease